MGKLYKGSFYLFFIALLGISTAASAQQELADFSEQENRNIALQTVSQQLLEMRISLNVEEMPVRQVLKGIQNQVGAQIVYTEDLLKGDLRVTLHSEKQKLFDVLDQINKQTGLKYWATGSFIIMRGIELPDQMEAVSGQVTDAASGEPLPGVNVIVKGTTTGISTDSEGEYQLNVPSLQDTLVFSFIGYQTQEVPINGRTSIDVALQTQAVSGEELVVIGYGSVQKSDLTGSVASVKDEEVNSYPSSDIIQSLTGRASGVEVSASSGAPGPGTSIRIRGTNSIQGNNDPLYVVDGVPLSGQPTSIDNSNVESIEILKDASATAIYGNRGANGVVLITTKGGVQGQTQVDFHAGYTIQTLRKKLDLMNAREYAELNNLQAENDNLTPYFTQQEIENYGEGTDWQDIVFDDAPIRKSSLGISGGNDNTQFSLGGSIFQQEGIIDGSDYNRYSFRTKINHQVSDKFSVDISANLTRLKTGRKDSDGGARGNSLVNAAITAPPTADPYNEDGTINELTGTHPFVVPDMTNPLFWIEEEETVIKANDVLGRASLIYKPIPKVSIEIAGAIENRDNRVDFFQSREFKNSDGNAVVNVGQSTNLLNENTISYNDTFGTKHKVSAVAGVTYQNFEDRGVSASGQGFLSNVFETGNLEAAQTAGIPSSSFTESTILSSLGRVNYTFDNKYLFTASFRADGSSRFTKGNKWGYFPSGAIAWRISEEEFMSDIEYISDFKLRSSWGVTGSQAISPYSTLNQLFAGNTVFGNQLYTTFAPGGTLPSKLKWETTEQFDVGLEIGLLDNRFFITADYFLKNTKDLLNTVSLPSSLGFDQTIRNVGEVQNSGFEFSIDANVVSRSDFSWSLNANGTLLNNEVKKLAGGEDILTNFVGVLIISDNVSILSEGRPIGQFYGFIEDGYDDQGNIKYQDLNNDGEITNEDKTFIGSPRPDFSFGFSSNLSYKQFDLTFFLNGKVGNDIFNVSKAPSTLDYGQGMNMPKEVLTDHWTPENTDAKYPRISRQASVEISDRFVEDGSYLRLKNIELAYNLPVQKMGFSNVRRFQLYVSGQNLITLTGYSWWDPEVNSRGLGTSRGIDHFSYPTTKSITLGVRAGF
ncbi:MAG: TonB-dependent receptor [Balneolaceae bacterium]|nr:TonB-dependent receptor [Balneolaceae bacterium]